MNQEGNNKRLFKGITIVFIANIVGSFFNIALNFFLPKYLSVEAYAGIKTYELYYTYAGILHFGFIDGVYLEYGGKSLRALPSEDIALRINTFRWFEIMCMLILVAVMPFLHNDIFFYFTLSFPTMNMAGLFQLLYQATGEYSLYSKILNATTISKTILSFFILIFISKSDYRVYIVGYVLLYLLLSLCMELSIRVRKIRNQSCFTFSFLILINEIKSGFSLRISVLSGFLLSSLDRIFVKIFMDTGIFAQYAFAATIENILNIMITPVTATLYNYFCNEHDYEQIELVKNFVIIASEVIIMLFFPIKFILEVFLKTYSKTLIVLAFLFVSKSLYIIIQGIYVNLYKAQKQQNKYLFKLIIVVCVGITTNILFYLFIPVKETFAAATLVTSFVWLKLSARDFKEITLGLKDVLYIVFGNFLFLLCACMPNSIVGFLLYAFLILLISFVTFSKEMKMIIYYGKAYGKVFIKKLANL